MFCHKCGAQLPETSGFCHKCGERVMAKKKTEGVIGNTVCSTPTGQRSKSNSHSTRNNTVQNTGQKKSSFKNTLYGLGRLALVVVIIILGIRFIGSLFSGSSESVQTPKPTLNFTPIGIRQDFGDCVINLKSYCVTQQRVFTTDYDILILVYEWTNNTGEAESFLGALDYRIYQNGIVCGEYNIWAIEGLERTDDSYDTTEIQAGYTQTVYMIYELRNASSPVTVEVENYYYQQYSLSHIIEI